MKTPIKITKGTTNYLYISLYDDEEPYILSDNEYILFGVKANVNSKYYVLYKKITSANLQEDYSYEIIIDPEDTSELPLGRYTYNIGLQSGKDFAILISDNLFEIISSVTEREE